MSLSTDRFRQPPFDLLVNPRGLCGCRRCQQQKILGLPKGLLNRIPKGRIRREAVRVLEDPQVRRRYQGLANRLSDDWSDVASRASDS